MHSELPNPINGSISWYFAKFVDILNKICKISGNNINLEEMIEYNGCIFHSWGLGYENLCIFRCWGLGSEEWLQLFKSEYNILIFCNNIYILG